MNDWFDWNNTRCTNYGIRVLNQPSIIRAQERVESIVIPGLSGSLTRTEGKDIFEEKNQSCVCIIEDDVINRIAKIGGWLRGGGNVTFANQPDGYYKARIANQIPFDKILRNHPHRSFSVEFICQPFFYLFTGDTSRSYYSGERLTNPGNIASAPIIKVTGDGDGTIMCGESTMLTNGLGEVGYIIIDCEAKIAYKGAPGDPTDPLTLLGTRVTGEWLTIPTGDSYFTFTGGISSVEITPRWRNV